MGQVAASEETAAALDAAIDGALPERGWPPALRADVDRRLDDQAYRDGGICCWFLPPW